MGGTLRGGWKAPRLGVGYKPRPGAAGGMKAGAAGGTRGMVSLVSLRASRRSWEM